MLPDSFNSLIESFVFWCIMFIGEGGRLSSGMWIEAWLVAVRTVAVLVPCVTCLVTAGYIWLVVVVVQFFGGIWVVLALACVFLLFSLVSLIFFRACFLSWFFFLTLPIAVRFAKIL